MQELRWQHKGGGGSARAVAETVVPQGCGKGWRRRRHKGGGGNGGITGLRQGVAVAATAMAARGRAAAAAEAVGPLP